MGRSDKKWCGRLELHAVTSIEIVSSKREKTDKKNEWYQSGNPYLLLMAEISKGWGDEQWTSLGKWCGLLVQSGK